jgi:predicted nucleic acid-binding protein
MKYLIDTNVWIDALAGKLTTPVFLKIVAQPNWAGYSAITRLELFGLVSTMKMNAKLLRY